MKRANKKLISIFIYALLALSNKLSSLETNNSFLLLSGSNIYVRIFLFYFPLAREYDIYFTFQKDTFTLEILIDKENIKKEPFTPSYFTTNILFSIKKIRYKKNGRFILPVSIRCNQKFIEKKSIISTYFKKNVFIINGYINDLYIKDITDDPFFKKRYNWKYPLYFDIRVVFSEKFQKELEEIFFK